MKSLRFLKAPLEELYRTYSSRYLPTDPVWFAHQYEEPRDQEAVAFLASALAYGSVPQIFEILRKILSELGNSPSQFIEGYYSQSFPRLFEGLYYRFHTAKDLRMLVFLLGRLYQKYGTLGRSFERHFDPQEDHLGGSLGRWVTEITEDLPRSSKTRLFFSSPFQGSSCKRLNLFLRWMVRGPDGVDFGLWDFVPPSKLLIPLDTHIYRVARELRLTRRKVANWKTAEEITHCLRDLDPHDPVKYDFALSRLGILEECYCRLLQKNCSSCKAKSRKHIKISNFKREIPTSYLYFSFSN